MTRPQYPPVNAEEWAARDRTRHALVPTVALALLLVVVLLAATYPVVVGLATLGLGSTAAAFTLRR